MACEAGKCFIFHSSQSSFCNLAALSFTSVVTNHYCHPIECKGSLFSDGIIEPVDIVDIVIVADGDVDDDYDGEGGEHEEEQDGLVQVVELDKGGEGENTENNIQGYSNFDNNSNGFVETHNKLFMKWGERSHLILI